MVTQSNRVSNSPDNSLQLCELYAKPDYLLIDHILDVGYIAEALMKYGRAHAMIEAIAKKTGMDFDAMVSSISWLCALHDIGKAHPYFIKKLYSKNESLFDLLDSFKERHLLKSGPCDDFRHERYSRDILDNYFCENGYPKACCMFSSIVAYHHQGKSFNDFSDKIILNDDNYTKIHKQIIDIVSEKWSFDRNIAMHYTNGVLYAILSIMVTSDWIASGENWRKSFNEVNNRQECANQFIENNELAYIPMGERFKDLSWNKVFGFEPNNLQNTIIKSVKSDSKLVIVEYPCGGGKTEAALTAALKMGKGKSGIYIATPTMSTAKGMTGRMNDLTKAVGLDLNIPEFDGSAVWSENDMHKIPKVLWTSRSRHKMLYPFAVGTIDQILKCILYARYGCISLTGLSDKVLIIDEVHAYDSYMRTELQCLLQWAKYLDIPVILLSATLPTITKKSLLNVYGFADEVHFDDPYPLITVCGDGYCKTIPVKCDGRKLRFNVLEAETENEAWQHIMSKQYDGCNAYIAGTVDRAWDTFRIATTNLDNVKMFNGRDTLKGKEDKTIFLTNHLGKNRMNRCPINLVSTSIIEQSLDIDLDRLFTCIAPIDLLIQRFGRVWRHSDKGTIREKETIEDPITIVIPKDRKSVNAIYGKAILENTISIIKDISEIDTVEDARRLIDGVYNSNELIDDISSQMAAGRVMIEPPTKKGMFHAINSNNSMLYERFATINAITRETSYPTKQIGIIDAADIENVNYDKLRNIMLNKVVNVAARKIEEDIVNKGIEPLHTDNDWLKGIILYNKIDLQNIGIELTEHGLKWVNN